MPTVRSPLVLVILAIGLYSCALPSAPTASRTVRPGVVLFQDDFASPLSGWERSKYSEGTMDYDRGTYRILVNSRDVNFWSTPHRDFSDVRIEVDVGKLDGPDENRLGLICRSGNGAYYFFIVSSDGYYGLGVFKNGKATLLGQDAMRPSEAIVSGTAINHLRLDCNADQLEAYVNGIRVASARDQTLGHGDVGLLAGTFDQPGADIVFDNFVVLQP
jgi:hypothetical protein